MSGSERDAALQRLVSRTTRRMGRRSFLQKAAAGVAGGVASVVLGVDARTAFAHGTCYPPGGRYCSGCAADSTCPQGYITCTPSTGWGCGVCPYTSGWWYTGTSPNRHKCRDCRIHYCPCTCGPNYYGFCGCKSTTHY